MDILYKIRSKAQAAVAAVVGAAHRQLDSLAEFCEEIEDRSKDFAVELKQDGFADADWLIGDCVEIFIGYVTLLGDAIYALSDHMAKLFELEFEGERCEEENHPLADSDGVIRFGGGPQPFDMNSGEGLRGMRAVNAMFERSTTPTLQEFAEKYGVSPFLLGLQRREGKS